MCHSMSETHRHKVELKEPHKKEDLLYDFISLNFKTIKSVYSSRTQNIAIIKEGVHNDKKDMAGWAF